MQSLLIIVAAILAGLQAVVDIARDPRIDRRFTIWTFRWIAVFFVYCAAGTALSIYVFGPRTALAGAFFVFFWVFEGVLWLVRKAPRLRDMPRWIGLKPTLWDVVFVGGIITCLAIGIAD